MNKQPPLILASGSKIRKSLLEAAGLDFRAIPADIDEDCLDLPSRELAVELSKLKAIKVSCENLGAVVIGCDQVLDFGGEPFSKAKNKSEAKARINALRGKTHSLNCGVCVAQNGEIIWEYSDIAHLTMHNFSDEFLDEYIKNAGAELTSSVGAYAMEGVGVQLFEEIKGDYFTILGLPLIALLNYLRKNHGISL